eukprot:gene32850-42529_t
MFPSLTPDEKALALAMSEISEAAYCAGWMDGLEFALWHPMTTGETRYGHSQIKKEEMENLRALSQKCGGWIVWDDQQNQIFVGAAEWQQRFQEGFAAYRRFHVSEFRPAILAPNMLFRRSPAFQTTTIADPVLGQLTNSRQGEWAGRIRLPPIAREIDLIIHLPTDAVPDERERTFIQTINQSWPIIHTNLRTHAFDGLTLSDGTTGPALLDSLHFEALLLLDCRSAPRRWELSATTSRCQQPTVTNLRKALVVALAVGALYVASYFLNSAQGGYRLVFVSSALSPIVETRGSEITTLGGAIVWQPRYGTFTRTSSDLLGKLYLPLIVADQALWHRDVPATDSLSRERFQSLVPLERVHPQDRRLYHASDY